MHEKTTYDLAGQVIGCAMTVHRELGPGFAESVYQNALALEMGDAGISFSQFEKLCVFYHGRPVGDFEADMIAGNQDLIIELKAVETMVPAHEVQLVNYLAATRIETGLLLNFGSASLQFKKKFLTYRASNRSPSPPALQS